MDQEELRTRFENSNFLFPRMLLEKAACRCCRLPLLQITLRSFVLFDVAICLSFLLSVVYRGCRNLFLVFHLAADGGVSAVSLFFMTASLLLVVCVLKQGSQIIFLTLYPFCCYLHYACSFCSKTATMEGPQERAIRERTSRIVDEVDADIKKACVLACDESRRITETYVALANELFRAVLVLSVLVNGFSSSGQLIAPPRSNNILVVPRNEAQDAATTDDAAIDFPLEFVVQRISETCPPSIVMYVRNTIANEIDRRNTHLQQDNRAIQHIKTDERVVQIGRYLHSVAFQHQSTQEVNDLAPYGAGLLSGESDCTAPKVAVDDAEALRRRLELTHEHVGLMSGLKHPHFLWPIFS